MANREEIRKLCEKLGPTRVKELLSGTSFMFIDRVRLLGNEHIAQVWLEENEARKNGDIKQQELNIAREANKIAKEAKDEAVMANYIAVGALLIALLSLLF